MPVTRKEIANATTLEALTALAAKNGYSYGWVMKIYHGRRNKKRVTLRDNLRQEVKQLNRKDIYG